MRLLLVLILFLAGCSKVTTHEHVSEAERLCSLNNGWKFISNPIIQHTTDSWVQITAKVVCNDNTEVKIKTSVQRTTNMEN